MESSIEFLMQACPGRTEAQIINIMDIIREENPAESPEQIVSIAAGMLLDQNVSISANNPSSALPAHSNLISFGEEQEGAVGFGHNNGTFNTGEFNTYFNELQSIFPDACEEFIFNYCQQVGHNFNLDRAIETFTNDGYNRKVVDVNTIWNRLQEALPFVDPAYLKKEAQRLVTEDENHLQAFVNGALENNDFPTKEDFLKREREAKELSLYTTNFQDERFLQEFPDPEKHFGDPNKQNYLKSSEVLQEDLDYALIFLYNKYKKIRKRHISVVFNMKNRSLWECCQYLDQFPVGMKLERPEEQCPESRNLALLQEVAYLKHRRYLRKCLKYKREVYNQFKEEARALNLLETCGVCCEDELIPEECFNCKAGCMFCKECVRKYVEVRMGDGLTSFPCCNDCESEFDLHILKMVLPRPTFEKLVLKIQSDEIRKANVDGAETCPFCEFVTIPVEESKIFSCQNPDCLKESCRLCRHESHVPLRCNEIEYDEDVKMRTHIENMMTEALTRSCYKCNKKFIKSDGCNKMTCTCGAMMCYLCSQPVNGYQHFGEPPKTCRLYTNDAQINLDRVKANAQRAKSELGNKEVKFDPTVGIENYF